MYKNPYVFKITIQQQQKCLNGVVKEKESELSLGQLFITWAWFFKENIQLKADLLVSQHNQN